MRTINKVILHCSASPDGRDVGLQEINEWHRDRKFSPSAVTGFFCGYHIVIRLDGSIEIARPDQEVGVHCKGENHDSIALCLVGTSKFTEAQTLALHDLLIIYLDRYNLSPKQVFGHCEFPSAKAQGKSCPNLGDMDSFRDNLEVLYYSF